MYFQTLRSIPAIVRKWWNGLPTKQAAIIEKITTNYISQQLCTDEFTFLFQKKGNQNENMTIKVYMPLRQVTATYSIDETKFELIITLPNNYPLGCIKVEAGKQIGGRLQSRQTVMQCTIFLSHQVTVCFFFYENKFFNENILDFFFSSRMAQFGMDLNFGSAI